MIEVKTLYKTKKEDSSSLEEILSAAKISRSPIECTVWDKGLIVKYFEGRYILTTLLNNSYSSTTKKEILKNCPSFFKKNDIELKK